MTCIVGFVDKKNNNVVIGADSAGTSGSDLMVRKDPKVFKVGEFVIGCTSSFRMMQLLRFSFTPPKIHDKDIYEYMCTDFVDTVRECFKNGGFLQKESKGDEKGGFFLVGYKDRLFDVECDFQVGENHIGYDCIGCGDAYAKGAIYNTTKPDADDIVLEALETAAHFSGAVQSPFIVLHT